MAGTVITDVINTSSGIQSTNNALLGAAKAWVNFDGTATSPITPRASYNVSSVTKNGTGDFTLNFTTALADANYTIAGVAATVGTASGWVFPLTSSPTTSSVRIGTYNTALAAFNATLTTVTICGNG